MDCGGTLSLRLPDGSTRALDPALTIGRADLGSLDARVSRHQVSVTALSSREARVDVHGSNKCLVVTDIGAERTRIGKGESARLKPEDIVYLYAPLDAPPLYPCKLWPTAAPEELDHFFAPEEPVRNSSQRTLVVGVGERIPCPLRVGHAARIHPQKQAGHVSPAHSPTTHQHRLANA